MVSSNYSDQVAERLVSNDPDTDVELPEEARGSSTRPARRLRPRSWRPWSSTPPRSGSPKRTLSRASVAP